MLLSLRECLYEYIVFSLKHTPLREAYLYTHQHFRFDLSRSIGPVAHTLKLLEARTEALRVAMSLYTLPSPYASCLGIITRLRGITRLVNGGLGLLLSPGSVIPGGACGVIENATGKGLSVAVIKVSCSGRPFCVTVIRMPARSKLRTLMPLSVPFSAIQ